MSGALIQYVLKAALRDKLMVVMLLLIIVTTSMSIFMASSAITEQDQFLAVYAAGSLRILSILGLVVFTAFFVRRSFDAKDVEFLLSRPVSRMNFVLSYAAGFTILALLTVTACSLALFVLSPSLFSQSFMLWCTSVMIEAIIMVNITFFFSMIISSATSSVLAVLAFYVLARMMGQILGILDGTSGGNIIEGVEITMNMVSALTPRLDLMGQTSWLIYGVGETINFSFVMIQGTIFVALVLIAGLIDMVLRQF